MLALQSLVPAEYWLAEFGAAYHRSWLWGTVAATLQTTALLLLVGLSIVKPEKARMRNQPRGMAQKISP